MSQTLVSEALYSGDTSLETILALMQGGDFDIDFQDPPRSGSTPLLDAIVNHREDVALELILRGANVKLADRDGDTPLQIACFYNLQSTARALVQAGADIDRGSLRTPLGFSAFDGNLSLVRAMLSWGADPSRVGTRHETARTAAEQLGHVGVVKFLDVCGSMLAVRSAEHVRRLASRSALKFLPKDLGRMVGAMLL
jgi:ankyrin repeat protein